jgi:hypothetical protein
VTVLTFPSQAPPATLRRLAELLDDDGVFDTVAGLLADLRDEYPRIDGDVDSGVLLERVITALRIAS